MQQGQQVMCIFLNEKNASKPRLREAENARKNRAEIVKAFSQGQVSRRDLMKWGLITTRGLLAPVSGLNPFVNSAYGSIPTGAPPSPLFCVQPFSTPMPRFDLLARNPLSSLTPTPPAQANQTQQPVPAVLAAVPAPLKAVHRDPSGPISASTCFPPRWRLKL